MIKWNQVFIKLLLYSTPFASYSSFNEILEKRRLDYTKGLPQVPLYEKDRIVSAKYITGDAFRAMSNHIFDETEIKFDASKVNEGDTVFVNGDFLDIFFEYVHENIKTPYILIIHNSDYSFPGKFYSYLNDRNIIAWFTVNPDMQHIKLHPIPIGFQNHHWNRCRNEQIDRVLMSDIERSYLLLMNFRSHTNIGERAHVLNLFKEVDYCYFPGIERDFEGYLNDLRKSKYCLSPFGNGKDCHRVYESLAMGCVPIVKTSALDQLYENLPILIIDSWQQIDRSFLDDVYDSIIEKRVDNILLSIDYWRFKVKSVGGNIN